MNESGVWAYLRKGMLTSGWHVMRIESSAGNGIPDVSYGIQNCNGFIELKYIKEWPKRGTTIVKIPLRPEQLLFFEKRGKLSGNVWCLIRIENDFFFFDHGDTINLATVGATKDQWMTLPKWSGRIDFKQFHKILEGGSK